MRQIYAILALITWVVLASPAAADDLIFSRGVLEDAGGALTITDVVDREFKPVGQTLSRGFTGSAFWLRLRVRAPADGNQVVLFIRQPFLNEIRLFQADAGDPRLWKTRVTGNYYPYRERDRARSTLGFNVRVTAPETTFYLRLKTDSVSQLTVEALRPDEADRKDHQFDLLEVFFVTSMLLLLLWAVHSYLLDRLPVVGLFAVHQAVYTLYGSAVTGYLAPWIPAGFPVLADLSTAIPYCGVNFTTLLFCRALFRPYEPPPALMRGLDILLLAFPLQLAAMAMGHVPLAVIANAILVRVTWWYLVVVAFSLRREQTPSRRLLRLFFVAVTLIFTLFWFTNRSSTAVTQGHLYGRQTLIVNGLIIGVLFAMILNARSRRLLQEAQQSATELRARSEFLALVSHEIRTPLNALAGFSSMARQTTDPAKIDQYLAIIEQSSRQLTELVNDILDMSKIEAERMSLESLPINPRRLVSDLEGQFRPLAEEKGLEFRLAVADDLPDWVLADPVRLRQILANLLDNAVKFTEQGSVSLTVEMAGRTGKEGRALVRLQVRDTGIGIPETSRPLLFQPFRQLDPTISRRYGGSGLGLAIVRSLTAMMDGSITVDSREGAGSTFQVDLPLQVTGPPVDNREPAVIPAPRTVLVVEDNEFNRRLLTDILTSWGQRIVTAEGGRQALELMEGQRFHLVLLDIRMPDIDGIEVARRIRERERGLAEPPVPIIAITADADAATRDACLAAGIDAVLAKPVVAEQLALAVAAYPVDAMAPPAREAPALDENTRRDLGLDRDRAGQYLEMLLDDMEEELRHLKAALERGDRDDLAMAAHTLKGLCGHLADRQPAELAAWLQQNAPTARLEEMARVIGRLSMTCRRGTTGGNYSG